jgi:hypothetical protein
VVTFLALLELWMIHNPGWDEPVVTAGPPQRQPQALHKPQ